MTPPYLSKFDAILQFLGQNEIVLEQLLDVEEDRRQLLGREQPRSQHRSVELFENDLQISAVLLLGFHDFRDDLFAFRPLLRTLPAHERRVHHAATRETRKTNNTILYDDILSTMSRAFSL